MDVSLQRGRAQLTSGKTAREHPVYARWILADGQKGHLGFGESGLVGTSSDSVLL